MKMLPATLYAIVVAMALSVVSHNALSAAEVGPTVRNQFGPDVGLGANQCRGACGGGCPSSCSVDVSFECSGDTQLRRVEAFTCGTHQGCREHDDCLDNCLRNDPQSRECQPQCDATAMQKYGFENATPWMLGKGPYDGQITFEYTRRAPADPEPAYRCPPGATRQCDGDVPCVGPNGHAVDAIFDTYPTVAANAMHISGLRAGPLCDGEERVCEQALNVRVAGEDTCPGGPCTRFGMEFDYANADPESPLLCKTSTRGGGDFVGDLIKLGGDALAERDAASGGPAEDDGMGQLLGAFSKIIASADSPEDLQVSVALLDEEGNPVESTRIGTAGGDTPAPIPASVAVPASKGRLFVPMYQLVNAAEPGTVKERRLTCTHRGEPVLETVFVLQH